MRAGHQRGALADAQREAVDVRAPRRAGLDAEAAQHLGIHAHAVEEDLARIHGSVPRRCDARAFHHQDHGALRRARSMHHAPGHDEALPRRQVDGAVLGVDEGAPADHVEELVLGRSRASCPPRHSCLLHMVVVLVPVVFALHHAEAYDRLVDAARRLVEPRMRDAGDERRHVDDLARGVLDVQARVVWKRGARIRAVVVHGIPPKARPGHRAKCAGMPAVRRKIVLRGRKTFLRSRTLSGHAETAVKNPHRRREKVVGSS